MMQSRVYAPSDKEDEAVEKLKDVISQSEQRRESVREVGNIVIILNLRFSVECQDSSQV
jgi:hypothetical protein